MSPDAAANMSISVSSIHVCEYTTCALLTNTGGSGVRCWGEGGYGQLARPNLMPNDIDVAYITDIDFGGSLTVSNVWCGSNANHICGKFSDESIRCWGRGLRGQRVRCHCHKVKLLSIYPRSTPFPSPFACPQGSGNTNDAGCRSSNCIASLCEL